MLVRKNRLDLFNDILNQFIDLYKKTIADLTEQNYQLMIRIKELTGTQCCGGKNHEK